MLVPFTVVTILGVAGLLAAERRDSARGRWLAKPVASIGFVGAGIAAGGLGSPHGKAVVVALVLSLLGDVFLISRSVRSFRAGLFAFLLGHVAFGVAFVVRGVSVPWSAAALVVLAPVIVVIGRWILPAAPRELRAPVVAYIVVITGMVSLAAGTVAAHGHPILLVAAVAFFLSDLSVARDAFVLRTFSNRVWGLPLYYGAQLLFAWALPGS